MGIFNEEKNLPSVSKQLCLDIVSGESLCEEMADFPELQDVPWPWCPGGAGP
jgi:hypothetical protein